MMQSKEGLRELEAAGISPYLCRLSVGLESVDEIIHTLQDALQGM
jgi:cystathionine beta-lyase/cystathionine gamma-synthase